MSTPERPNNAAESHDRREAQASHNHSPQHQPRQQQEHSPQQQPQSQTPVSATPEPTSPGGSVQSGSQQQRRKMQWDTVVGFLTFFAVVALIQAVRNVLAPEPQMAPALTALVLVIAAVSAWRYGRSKF